MICSGCGAENDNNAIFCNKCGKSLMQERICKNCNTVNKADAVFCEKCGSRLHEDKTSDEAPTQQKHQHRSKMKKILLIGVITVVAVVSIAAGVYVIRPIVLRSQVDNYIENMQYAKAQEAYEKLPYSVQDQTEYLTISLLADIENGNYVAASSKLVRLGGYEDAAELIDNVDNVIDMIQGNGVDLPTGQSNQLSDVIQSIAIDAIARDKEEEEKLAESRTLDNDLIGTWRIVEFQEEENAPWEPISSAAWSGDTCTFYSDGKYDIEFSVTVGGFTQHYVEYEPEEDIAYCEDDILYLYLSSNAAGEEYTYKHHYKISGNTLIIDTYGLNYMYGGCAIKLERQ